MSSGKSVSTLRVSRPLAVVASTLLIVSAMTVVPSAAAGAQGDPTRTPVTTLSADGRSGTDGVRTLTVSQSTGLAPTGQTIRVTGSGYDPNKGIYVALCVIPPPNVLPTPCGGGVDIEGQADASQWISSDPPSYGAGLARPYGPGGTFDTTFSLSAAINPTVDCRFVRCAVLTRNDHTRSSDRSQDILIPVTFATPTPTPTPVPAPAPVPGTPAPQWPTPAPAPEPPPSTAPIPETTAPTTTSTTPPAPDATVAKDGRSVSDGTRTLRAARVDGLDPAGETVTVAADGLDPERGIYVSLCATPDDAAPGPCSTGGSRSGWFSSNPPEWGEELAVEFDDGGAFELDLELVARIDGDTDCTEVDCAIVVRSDDTAPEDRSLDLALPVSFELDDASDEVESETGTDAGEDAADVEVAGATIASGDIGSSTRWLVLAAIALLVLAAGAVVTLRRRGGAA